VKITLLVLICVAATTAHAADWRPIASDGATFVDAASLHRHGALVTVWWKAVTAPHTVKGIGRSSQAWLKEEWYHDTFDCAKRSMRNDETVLYYDDGSRRGMNALHTDGVGWQAITANSTMDLMLFYVCLVTQNQS
jgi:hypothetical protein